MPVKQCRTLKQAHVINIINPVVEILKSIGYRTQYIYKVVKIINRLRILSV